MSAKVDYTHVIYHELSEIRKKAGALSSQTFAKLYLQHHFPLEASAMQESIFEYLDDATVKRPVRYVVAAPRGHAKSTVVSLAYVLWCVAHQKENFILLLSATKEQASELLTTIKKELETNSLLMEDFPEMCYPTGKTPRPWRDNKVTLNNGVMIRAIGAGQAIRGTKHRQHRPTLIIVDDVEDQERVTSAEQRQKLKNWFEKTLLKTGEPCTNVVVIGTILHYDSLLANLLDTRKTSGWKTDKYQAVLSFSEHPELWEQWEAIYDTRNDYKGKYGPNAAQAYFLDNKKEMLEGTWVSWRQRESYLDLMIMRAREGRLSFQTEKQNNPLDPADCLFRESDFRYWDDEFRSVDELIRELGNNGRFYGACDPSLGRKGGLGDYTGIITLLKCKRTNMLYVIGADIGHYTPAETIERIVTLHQMYDFTEFAVEDNQFQELLIDQIERRASEENVMVYLEGVTHTTDKKVRIQSLEPLISHGRIQFSRKHHLLIEQLRQYPMGAHDDGPDALEMVAKLALGDSGRVIVSDMFG